MGTIYVWLPAEDSVGHCSLQLDDGTYISWWPKENQSEFKKKRKKVNAKEHLPDSYSDDVEEMGRSATHKFTIGCNKINSSIIKSWWQYYKIHGDGYHLISNNCCNVVLKGLKAGGAFEWVHPGIIVIATPNFMVRYGRALEKAREKEPPRCKIM